MKQKDELYQEFLELLMQGLKERLGEEYNIQLNSILKNNSIHMDGIVIRKGEERITPNIYVEEFYEDYENEVPIEDIIDRITYIYFEKIIFLYYIIFNTGMMLFRYFDQGSTMSLFLPYYSSK